MDNNDVKQSAANITCFSYSRRDIVILLMIYNTAYFFIVSLVRHDLIGCVLTAFTIFLVALFIFTLFDMYEKLNEEVRRSNEEAARYKSALREEYLKVHQLRKKAQLLNNGACEHSERGLILTVDAPHLNLYKNENTHSQVHFTYLHRDSMDKNNSDNP